MKKIALASLALIAAALCLRQLIGDGEALPSSPTYAQLKQINQQRFEQPTTKASPAAGIPASLAEVHFQADFQINHNRRLIPTLAVRELFDHYLSSLGETDLAGVIRLIQAEIHNALPEPARSEAFSLLKRYIDYKIALAELDYVSAQTPTNDPAYADTLVATQSALHALRSHYFDSAESAQFFAREDAQNDYMIAQIRISRDTTLTKEEKRSQLAQAATLLPADIAASRLRVQKHAHIREQVTEVQASGASEEVVFQLRENSLGTEAAQALAQLDQDRKAWKERLTRFSAERTAILISSLSDEDKAASVDALLTSHFDKNEHKRVRAIMGDGRLD